MLGPSVVLNTIVLVDARVIKVHLAVSTDAIAVLANGCAASRTRLHASVVLELRPQLLEHLLVGHHLTHLVAVPAELGAHATDVRHSPSRGIPVVVG